MTKKRKLAKAVKRSADTDEVREELLTGVVLSFKMKDTLSKITDTWENEPQIIFNTDEATDAGILHYATIVFTDFTLRAVFDANADEHRRDREFWVIEQGNEYFTLPRHMMNQELIEEFVLGEPLGAFLEATRIFEVVRAMEFQMIGSPSYFSENFRNDLSDPNAKKMWTITRISTEAFSDWGKFISSLSAAERTYLQYMSTILLPPPMSFLEKLCRGAIAILIAIIYTIIPLGFGFPVILLLVFTFLGGVVGMTYLLIPILGYESEVQASREQFSTDAQQKLNNLQED